MATVVLPEASTLPRIPVLRHEIEERIAEQVLGYYMTSWTYRLPKGYWDKYPAQIMAGTAARAQTAATKSQTRSRRKASF